MPDSRISEIGAKLIAMDRSHHTPMAVPPVALVGISGYGQVLLTQLLKLAAGGELQLAAAVVINASEEAARCAQLQRDGTRLYTSAVLVGPQGLIGRYRKLHLFLNEKGFFQPGDAGLPVFDIGFCRLGLLICFDWIFPEAWRVLALKGADVVCHPSNLVLPGLAQRGVPVHALMNRIYVVTGNRVGTEGNLTYTGQSLVADPLGDVLVQASPTGEEAGIAEADVALARNKQVTPRNDVLADRRPEEYGGLCTP